MRQAGVIAAAGLVGLDEMVDRLADDHRRARRLADAVADHWPRCGLDPTSVQTNVVVFRHPNPSDLIGHLRRRRHPRGLHQPGRRPAHDARGRRRQRCRANRRVDQQRALISARSSPNSRRPVLGPGGVAMLDGLPLAHGAQREHGHHRHTGRSQHGPHQRPESRLDGAVTFALQVDERVTDEAAGHPRQQDQPEGEHPSAHRRQGRSIWGGGEPERTAREDAVTDQTSALIVRSMTRNPNKRVVQLPRRETARGVAHVQRGREHRRGARPGAGRGAGSRRARRRRRQPRRHRRPGREVAGAITAASSVLRRAGKQGLGSAYRAGFAQGLDAGLRRPHRDGLRPPARSGGAPRAASHAVEDGADLAIGSPLRPGRLDPGLEAVTGGCSPRAATSTPRSCSACGARRHGGLPGLPAPTPCAQIDLDRHQGRRLRVPDRDGLRGRAATAAGSSRCRSPSPTGSGAPRRCRARIVVEALLLVTWWGVRDRVVRRPTVASRRPRYRQRVNRLWFSRIVIAHTGCVSDAGLPSSHRCGSAPCCDDARCRAGHRGR